MASLQDLVRHSTASWLANAVKLCLTMAHTSLAKTQEEGPLPDEDSHLQEVAFDLKVRMPAFHDIFPVTTMFGSLAMQFCRAEA